MNVNLNGNTITNAYFEGVIEALPNLTANGFVKTTDGDGTLTVEAGIEVSDIDATGSPSSTTYLRGDGTWSTPPGPGATTLTGDVTGSGTGTIATTVGGINGTHFASLATGLLYNTTGTGAPSTASASQIAAQLTGATGALDLSGTTLQIPNGTSTTLATLTPARGEPYWTTDGNDLFIGDNSTAGGIPVVRPQGRIIYVSQSFGSDTRYASTTRLPQQYDPNRPYYTLTAALAAATSGDTIWALDGTFTDTNLAPVSNLSFYFAPGATVNASGTVFSMNSNTAPGITGVTVSGCGQTLTSSGSILVIGYFGYNYGGSIVFNNLNLKSTSTCAITGGSTPSFVTVNGNVTGAGSATGTGGAIGIPYGSDIENVVVNGTVTNASGPATTNLSSLTTFLDVSETSASTVSPTSFALLRPKPVITLLSAPGTGFTQSFASINNQILDIAPSSTLATGTVTLPSGSYHYWVGQTITINNLSVYTIAALTVTPSGTLYGWISGSPLAGGGSLTFQCIGIGNWICTADNSVPKPLTTSNTTSSVTFNTNCADENVINTSSSTISSLALTFPSNSRPNQVLSYTTAGAVTALTSSGITLDNGSMPTSLSANASIIFKRSTASGHWIRTQ